MRADEGQALIAYRKNFNGEITDHDIAKGRQL